MCGNWSLIYETIVHHRIGASCCCGTISVCKTRYPANLEMEICSFSNRGTCCLFCVIYVFRFHIQRSSVRKSIINNRNRSLSSFWRWFRMVATAEDQTCSLARQWKLDCLSIENRVVGRQNTYGPSALKAHLHESSFCDDSSFGYLANR